MMVQETYKTTWLAKVPEHWETLRIKNIFAEIDERSETGQEELLSVSHYTGVTKKRDNLENETDFISNAKTLVGYKKVAENDLVSNIMLAWNGSLGISKYNGITSPAYCVYRIKGDNNPNYFGYLFSTAFMKAEFRKKSFGIIDSRLRLYSDKFFSITSPVPPKTEQDQIVTYIKEQSKKIKHFIKKKQTFIALLKEQRQAVINKAVTKGLNPNVTMRDSGVDWLGVIPKHWEVRKLKFASDIIYGISPNEKSYNDKGVGSILINGPVEYSKEDFGYTRSLKWTTEPQKFAPKNSLLFCLRGSTTGRLNICHADVAIGRGVAAIIGNLLTQEYLVCIMIVLRKNIENSFKGSTFPSVTSRDLNNYYISIPPKEEQTQIVTHIKNETAKIDEAIAKAQREIELIKEYKEAMIAEAVLGKYKMSEL
ncbi:restriction endonuclease subunit S [bacterium]|nr:restriction endonuclease subunit S [bacterium]